MLYTRRGKPTHDDSFAEISSAYLDLYSKTSNSLLDISQLSLFIKRNEYPYLDLQFCCKIEDKKLKILPVIGDFLQTC